MDRARKFQQELRDADALAHRAIQLAHGGVPGYTWSLRSGQLPPGLSLSASPGRITGTPTTRGTFSFLVRVTDSRGAFAERTFSITIS